MQVKTSKLKDKALDWAVAKCEGEEVRLVKGQLETLWTDDGWRPSSNWAQGGPIIEREIDSLRKRSKAEESSLAYPNPNFRFKAEISSDIDGYFCGFGPTLLIAAMRCYIASKLGETVDIPEELI